MSYLIVFVIGILIGVILTNILLSGVVFEKYRETTENISSNYAAAKAVYELEVYGETRSGTNNNENENDKGEEE